jgi:hypothetical protein
LDTSTRCATAWSLLLLVQVGDEPEGAGRDTDAPRDPTTIPPLRANVAVQRAILTAIWHMGTTDNTYIDPGADYFTRLNPAKARAKAVRQLEAMGYDVTLDHAS